MMLNVATKKLKGFLTQTEAELSMRSVDHSLHRASNTFVVLLS